MLIGDVKDWSLTMATGTATASGNTNIADVIEVKSRLFLDSYDFTYGNDSLENHGNNGILIGDVKDWSLTMATSTATTSNNSSGGGNTAVAAGSGAGFNSSDVTYGNDSLKNHGDNAILIADVKNWSLTITACAATSSGNSSTDFLSRATTEWHLISSDFTYGNDFLENHGNNAILIGDVKDWSLTMAAGTATVSDSTDSLPRAQSFSDSSFSDFTYGNDSLENYGNNAILIGDVKDWSLTMAAGTATVSDHAVSAVVEAILLDIDFTYGNDTLTVHSDTWSDNILIGDVDLMNISLQHGAASTDGTGTARADAVTRNNTFTLGDDTLISGRGNDDMWGDIREFHGQILDADSIPIFTLDSIDKLDIIDFLDEAGANNLLTGGEDCFVFNISESIGDNVIYDFDIMGDGFVGDDTLLFVTDILDFDCENPDADDVDDLSTLINLNLGDDVNGNLVVDVIDTNTNDSLGTITFSNIDYVLANTELANYGIQVGADFA